MVAQGKRKEHPNHFDTPGVTNTNTGSSMLPLIHTCNTYTLELQNDQFTVIGVSMHACVCVHVCVHACVRACMRV